MALRQHLRIRLLSVPDCPLVEPARTTLESSLAKTNVDAVVEELVGDYSSPTILIDGFDVTGQPKGQCNQAACRLDLPTEEQILVALRSLFVLSFANPLARRLQAAAFKALLQTAKPVSVDDLAVKIGSSDNLTNLVEDSQKSSQVQLNSSGHIVGALGLTLSPTKHDLSINGSRFWAWCAFDVLGIFGALNASGHARSADPSSGNDVFLEFVDGKPQKTTCMVFIADVQSNTALREAWCSKVNFFNATESAEAWVKKHGLVGSLVSVNDLVPLAVEVWSRALAQDEDSS